MMEPTSEHRKLPIIPNTKKNNKHKEREKRKNENKYNNRLSSNRRSFFIDYQTSHVLFDVLQTNCGDKNETN